jgi:hypothetical protein
MQCYIQAGSYLCMTGGIMQGRVQTKPVTFRRMAHGNEVAPRVSGHSVAALPQLYLLFRCVGCTLFESRGSNGFQTPPKILARFARKQSYPYG